MATINTSLRRRSISPTPPTTALPADAYGEGQMGQGAYADLIGGVLSSYAAGAGATTAMLPPRPAPGDAGTTGSKQPGAYEGVDLLAGFEELPLDVVLNPVESLDPTLSADIYEADIAELNALETNLTDRLSALDETFAAQEALILGQRTGQRNNLNLAGISGASGLRSRALSVEEDQFRRSSELRVAQHQQTRRVPAEALAGIDRDRDRALLSQRSRDLTEAHRVRAAETGNLQLIEDAKDRAFQERGPVADRLLELGYTQAEINDIVAQVFLTPGQV